MIPNCLRTAACDLGANSLDQNDKLSLKTEKRREIGYEINKRIIETTMKLYWLIMENQMVLETCHYLDIGFKAISFQHILLIFVASFQINYHVRFNINKNKRHNKSSVNCYKTEI